MATTHQKSKIKVKSWSNFQVKLFWNSPQSSICSIQKWRWVLRAWAHHRWYETQQTVEQLSCIR